MCIVWVQPHNTCLPGVMVAPEPCAGVIALQLEFLPPCLLAFQSLATFSNGSYLSLGPSKAKGGIMRELLDDMDWGLALMPPPFHLGPLSWIQVLERLGWQGALEEHMVEGLVAQVLRSGEPQISFHLLFH
jgi:hypothetical protein